MTTERDYQLIPCPGCGVVNPNSWDDHDLSCPQMPDNIKLIAERDSLRAQVAEARKRADRVVAVWEDQEVRGWWDRMDATIAALGGE